MRRARMTADTATLDLFLEDSHGMGDPSAAAPPVAPSAAEVLALLRRWADAGLLRRLDCALAHFVHEHDPLAPPCVLVAAALLVQMEGRGHSCLPLADVVAAPQAVLGWAAPDSAALQTLWAQLPGALPAWLQALAACPLVRVLERDADQGQPLVLACEQGLPALLYLRRYWDHERRVASAIRQRSQDSAASGTSGAHGAHGAHGGVDPAQARQWLDRFFPPPQEGQGSDCDWQKVACALALRGRMAVITGGPGTGKTYTAARLLALLFATAPDAGQLRVALAAPTGKAAARLKQAIDEALNGLQAQLAGALDLQTLVQRMGPARTLHALLGARPGTRHFSRHAGAPLDLDVLIVDEASMVHLEMMSALLAALAPTTRLVLLGDKDQLASVEAGAVMGELCRGAHLGGYSAATAHWVAQAAGETLPAQFLHGVGAGATGPAGTGAPSAPALAQHSVMLRTSRRFAGPIGALANAVNQGDATAALTVLLGQGGVVGAHLASAASAVALAQAPALAQVVDLALHGRGGTASYAAYARALGRWREIQAEVQAEIQAEVQPAEQQAGSAPGNHCGLPGQEGPAQPAASGQAHAGWVREVLAAFERFRLLCAVREGDWGVAGLNRAVEQALERAGHIRRRAEWYAGRPVMVTRNDPALGVFNGDIGIALPGAAPGHALRVYFLQGEQVRSVGVTRLAQVETAFAMTVHKAQGSEFEHTALVLSASAGPVLGRELVYTGITRARQAFTLLTERTGLLQQAIAQPTRRASGLEPLLAGRRGERGG